MRHGLLLFFGFLCLYLIGAARYDLLTDDEIRYAEAGRQMLVTGDWLIPAYNGRPRFQKPILCYWLQAAAQYALGSTPWAARVPSALAGAMAVCLTWFLGCRAANPRVGLWAAIILGLSVHMFLVSRMVLTDGMLLLCLQGTITCVICARLAPDPWLQGSWYRGMYFCMALGLLTKGPIAVLLPTLVLVPWLWRRGELRRTWRHCRPWSGLLILLLLAGPWYVAATYVTGGAYLEHFLWHENWGRFTEVVNRHHWPAWFHALLLLPLIFPWIGLLGPSLQKGWTCQAQGPFRTALPSLWLWQILVVLVLCTFSRTKVWTYVLPLGPALALLMATWLDLVLTHSAPGGKHLRCAFSLFSVLTLGIAAAMHFLHTNILPSPLTECGVWPRLQGAAWLLAGLALITQATLYRASLLRALQVLASGIAGWYVLLMLSIVPCVDETWRTPLRIVADQVRHYPDARLFTVQIHELGLNFSTGLERVHHRRRGCEQELQLHLTAPYPVFVLVSCDHEDCLAGLPFHVWQRWPGLIFGANLPPPPSAQAP